ncbi:MAG: hypothetical protein U0941_28935 [Planctomycetaceae bacterium]
MTSAASRERSISPQDLAGHIGMALTVGVMGGAGRDIPKVYLAKAEELGEAVGDQNCVLVTGACPGLPFAAARGAKRKGATVVGISPGLSLCEHAYKYESPTAYHDILIFTGSGLMGREVVNIRSSDIVAFIGGSSGTLGELAIAYDEGKLIGILTGTGGISDLVSGILSACQKQTGARVVYDDQPRRLVTELLRIYREEHHRRPSVFCHELPATGTGEAAPEAERDPVCGMWINPQTAAAKRTIHGERLVFCSLQCAADFDDHPARLVAEPSC